MKLTCYATPQDHDIMRGFMKDCAPTLSAAAGHSGNNRPFFCRMNSTDRGGHLSTYVKVSRARHKDGEGERWARQDVSPTLNLFDLSGDTRACTLVVKISK